MIAFLLSFVQVVAPAPVVDAATPAGPGVQAPQPVQPDEIVHPAPRPQSAPARPPAERIEPRPPPRRAKAAMPRTASARELALVQQSLESKQFDEAVDRASKLVERYEAGNPVSELAKSGGWRGRAGRALESAGDRLQLLGPPPGVRAEAEYGLGLAQSLAAPAAPDEDARTARRADASTNLEHARLLAGPGELRLDATYEMGLLEFDAGEEQRAKIPEISGQPPQPPMPAAPNAAATGAEAPPDPLQLARAAYQRARAHFCDRLRMDWKDADTRANVELCQRRLRELDEIEKKREQEKKEQEQQQKDQQKDQKQQDQKDSKPEDSKDKEKPEDAKPKDPGEDRKEDPKEQEPPPDPKEEKPEDAMAPEPKPADPKDAEKMSKEEELQLRDRLQKIDEIQKELAEKLKRQRKVSVEKDW